MINPAANIEQTTMVLLDNLSGRDRTPSSFMSGKEAAQAVQSAIRELPEHYRQAVWMVYVEGCSVEAAANQMGRSDRAVHGLCRRGLRNSRES